jgi:hypothetical protein
MAMTLWSGETHEKSRSTGRAGTAWRVGVLVATAALAIAKACSMPRIPQPQDYFAFADGRTFLGVPNALNVLSNAAFAVVGAAGLLLLRGRITFRDARERWPWVVFFVGVALTSVGSAWFHLAPSNESLVWDRLPMAVGFMGLFAALVSERISPAAGLRLLGPLVAAGIGSVIYWIATEHAGAGDLRPYYVVQFYPLAAILLVLVLFRPAYTGTAGWLVGLGSYGTAKWAEVADGRVFAALGFVSGHTLKHLLAAAGIAALLVMLRRRRAIDLDLAVT